MAKILTSELLDLFYKEVESYIPEMQQCLNLLAADNGSKVALEELYRLFQNIKAGSSLVKLTDISAIAGKVEVVLEGKLESRQSVDDDLLNSLDKARIFFKEFALAKDSSGAAEESTMDELEEMFSDPSLFSKDSIGDEGWQRNNGSTKECLKEVSSVFPLLQELVACLQPASSDPVSVTGIYSKLSGAVSLMAETVSEAGMQQHGTLLSELKFLLDHLAHKRINHQPEVVGLLGDFFHYFEIIFSRNEPEQLEFVDLVQEKLSLLNSVLGLSTEQGSDPEKLGIDGTAEQSEDESIVSLGQLDDSELIDEAASGDESLSVARDSDEPEDDGDDARALLAENLQDPDADLEDFAEEVEDEPDDDSSAALTLPIADDQQVERLGEQPSDIDLQADLTVGEDFNEYEKQLLLEIFGEECDEHLIVINQSLNVLETEVTKTVDISPPLKDCLRDMRRALHTLKGAASVADVQSIAKGAHSLEDMLDWLHDSASEIGPEEVQILATGIDLTEIMAQDVEESEPAGLERLVHSIDEYLASGPKQKVDDEELPAVHSTSETAREGDITDDEKRINQESEEKPGQEFLTRETGSLRVKLEDLDELQGIEGELEIAGGAMEKMVEEFSQTLLELDKIKENLRRNSQELVTGFEELELDGINPVAPGGSVGEMSEDEGTDSDSMEPELDRYSQLNLTVNSLDELCVDVNSISSTLTLLAADISGQVDKQQLIFRLMQDKLMRIRMTPLASISKLLHRTVRETATVLEKKVNLTISGEDVCMDGFIRSKLTSPLIHLLRNSVDHGIESAETRKSLGKPDIGTIKIEAEQRSRHIILHLSDDGGGVDPEFLKQKLRESGHLNEADRLTESELLLLLFQQSISTKEGVSTISGRGVGLDVVKRSLEDMGGTVELINEHGKGVTFELIIPSTLKILSTTTIPEDA